MSTSFYEKGLYNKTIVEGLNVQSETIVNKQKIYI